MYRIAYFEVRTFRKRQTRDSLRFDDTILENLAEEAAEVVGQAADRRRALRHCEDKLSEEDRELIRRRYHEEPTTAALARQIGRSPNSVGQSLTRIRSSLLECIERFLSREDRS